jgi:alanine racemase
LVPDFSARKGKTRMNRYFNIVEIDLNALAHNLSEVRRLVGDTVKIMAVVKADAYGHGGIRSGLHLVENGADALGVMDLHEAASLRDAGINLPIYILAGILPEYALEIVDRNLTPFVYDLELAKALDHSAAERNRVLDIHLKMDTGMHRLGRLFDDGDDYLSQIAALNNIRVTGLATHFAEADVEGSEFTNQQLDRLKKLIEKAKNLGMPLSLNNSANSAAVLGAPQTHLDMVRPGLMLYGDWPADHLKPVADLKPVMTFKSQVIQVKTLKPGGTVSYGRTWKADQPTRIATVPTGYAHGLNRLLSNKGEALIRGRRAPLRGRVCMNLTMFDVTDIPDVAPGDEVVFLGRQGNETITGGMLADLCGTISYEVFCAAGGVNHRHYI